ncbi:hypothetical protein ACFE04_012929 [Oxalis oulophora]
MALSRISYTAPLVFLFSIFLVNSTITWFRPNTPIPKSIWFPETLNLTGHALGPESFAFDLRGGGPYTGVSDGRIIKWDDDQHHWIDFAVTTSDRDGCEGSHKHDQTEDICGRPLGIRFDQLTGDLYIADAYKGLLKVGPNGGLATALVTSVGNKPLRFTNSLDIDPSTGIVYFTDSSSLFQRRNHMGSILTGEKTGRLLKYDPISKQVTVLQENIPFANGVALSKDGDFILIAETTSCRVLKYWLKTPKAGTLEVFAELPGFVDNIQRSPRGGYWMAMHSRRSKFVEILQSYPQLRKLVFSLPGKYVMKAQATLAKFSGNFGVALRLSEDGEVLENFTMKFGSISEVMERDGQLWIGSVTLPFASRYKL